MKPKRLDNKSEAGSQLNLEALYTIAPSCFTEVQDPKTGETKRVVNFEILRTLLGDDAVETDREMYQFTWPGKQAARLEAVQTTNETLRPVPQDSLDWDNTENLYIEGDNLRVLKLLQKSYLGKIKMIYIDPPYNTGKDLIYHDDFSRSATEENLAAGNIDEEGYRFRVNPDTNGRFHSDWCSMMYSRLLVAHSLLSEDGVIFISIDDNEVHNLRKICDEVFGAGNFVAELIWEQGRKSMAAQIAVNHEYCIIYCKDKNVSISSNVDKNLWRIAKNGLNEIYAEFARLQELHKDDFEAIERGLRQYYRNLPEEHPSKAHKHYCKADQFLGIYHPDNISQGTGKGGRFDILHPITQKACKVPTGGWRFSINKLPELLSSHRIVFGDDETTIPCLKRYLKETETEVCSSVFYKDGRGATSRLKSLLGGKYFDYPKDEEIMMRFISLICPFSNDGRENSLILDFFSGSATTAHAVMQLNAEDGGKRKYICVQLEEETPEKSEARKAGYNTIPEIAKERIRRAGKKIKEENPEVTDTLDTGFRVFKLDSSNYEEVSKTPGEYEQAQLDLFLNNIKTDRTELDLLFGAMLSWGVPLSLSQPLQTEVVDGCTIYNVTDGELVACFAEKVTEAVVEAMAALQPERVLFRDSCFADDKMKINIFELFKQQLDWDEREALDNIRVI
jgi:site-specific DNA-methyltransferase (adenine-specific)